MMQFELPKERPSIIKVIGVGGGGSNAVNYMYRLGIKGVDFMVCNTDNQALEISPVPHKIQLGPSLTEGRGAGALPEVGKQAAIENVEDLRAILRDNTKMVFITAGMGGGTGTGAAPIIAGVAREMGILTVAIVTVPFAFEGKKRRAQADKGIEELKQNVDTLLVICNDKLREIHGNLKLSDAFSHADNILAVAAKSIAEIITTTLHINVDFADIDTVMKESGVAIMGSASADGENRAMDAVMKALDSPLLNDNEIEGARYILLNITSGNLEVSMDEMGEITDYVQEQAGQTAEVIMGVGNDESLGDQINVTIIATGFKTKDQLSSVIVKEDPKVLYDISGELLNKNKPAPESKTEVTPEAATETEEPRIINEPTLKVVPIVIPNNLQPLKNESLNQQPAPSVPGNESRIVHTLTEDNQIITNEQIQEPASQVNSESNDEIIAGADQTDLTEDDKTFVFEVRSQPVQSDLSARSFNEPIRSSVPNTNESERSNLQSQPLLSEQEDPYARARARVNKLKELSMKFSSAAGLSDLEKEPAYKRKGIQLDNVVPSNQTDVSKHTLSNDAENRPEIKPNNPFLHDRVD